jgi:hypothetical protein
MVTQCITHFLGANLLNQISKIYIVKKDVNQVLNKVNNDRKKIENRTIHCVLIINICRNSLKSNIQKFVKFILVDFSNMNNICISNQVI